MDAEAIRGLVTITAIVAGTTGLLSTVVGLRALLVLPVFALAFAYPGGMVTTIAYLTPPIMTVAILYMLVAVHLRHRFTVPEFGRSSRRARAVTVLVATLGLGMVMLTSLGTWALLVYG